MIYEQQPTSFSFPDAYHIRYGYSSPDSQPMLPEAFSGNSLLDERKRFAPDMVAHTEVDNNLIAVVDKNNPHTLTDAMISVFGGDRPIISFGDASDETRRTVLSWMHGFARYVVQPGTQQTFNLTDSFMRIAVNIDHQTRDRGGIQGVRALHPHCLCFPEIEEYPALVPIDPEKDAKNKHALNIDPAAKAGEMIIKDYFDAGQFSSDVYEIFESPSRDEDIDIMPLAFTLRFKESWDGLISPSASSAMGGLDKMMGIIYGKMRQAVTGLPLEATLGPWQRPRLLSRTAILQNIDALPILSEATKAELAQVCAQLRNVPERVIMRLQKSREAGGISLAEKILSLAGVAYCMNFYSPGKIKDMSAPSGEWQRPAYLSIQPAVRRATGVAGFNIDSRGRLFKVEREQNSKPMDCHQLTIRKDFQQQFARFLGIG